ncbi:MAG: DUF1524 domain-containing protein [Syntrophobacteraceae bacterium]
MKWPSGEGIHSGVFPEGEAGDNRLIQYILVYLQVGKNADNYWQSGETAYSILRQELLYETDKSKLLQEWLQAIQEMCVQLKHLNDCILGSEPSVMNPSPICNGRTIKDDYDIIIRSLGLSPRSIAVMLRFRAMYSREWHESFPMKCINCPDSPKPLSDHLNQIRGGTKNSEIYKLIDNLETQIASFDAQIHPYHFECSMLQVVERMELLIWKRYDPRGTFKDKWNAVFGNSAFTAHDAVVAWYSWYYTECDFPRFIQDNEHEPTFRYILGEYESYINGGINIHFDNDLTLEHIFPKNPNPKPPPNFGFGTNPNDYDRFINRVGNLTFVYQNESLSNATPDIKAHRYVQSVDGISKFQPAMTRQIGSQLIPLTTDYSAYRDALRVRCTEMALFSLKRFFFR